VNESNNVHLNPILLRYSGSGSTNVMSHLLTVFAELFSLYVNQGTLSFWLGYVGSLDY